MKLKRFWVPVLVFVLLLSSLSVAAGAPADTIAVSGVPEALTLGQSLPWVTPTVAGGLLCETYWFASRDGIDTPLEKPLSSGSTVQPGRYYYLGLLVAGAYGASGPEATVNGLPAHVQEVGAGKWFLSVRYDRRSHRLDGLHPEKFSDVSDRAWYGAEVAEAAELGLVQGVTDHEFAPEALASRSALLTMLHRLRFSPEAPAPGFSDVPQNLWYTQAVGWGAQEQIILGYEDNSFRPDEAVTREQVAVFLYRYAVSCGYDTGSAASLSGFADANSVSPWAASAVSWAVAQGLLSGSAEETGLMLEPLGYATRAQIAALLCRLLRAYPENVGQEMPEYHTAGRLTLGYIPLDNRPVNDTRPVWLAQSAGMTVLMPEESLYATRLDNQTPNPNGTTFGDRVGLLNWLKENEDRCDAFVLSMDQLLSGGLVSSRALHNQDLSYEFSVIDYLEELAARKPVYVFDTGMRLASTVNYEGLGLEEYYLLRSYGSQGRQLLTGGDLTPEQIIAGYPYAADGSLIETALPADALEKYLEARSRKLRLSDYLLRHAENFRTVVIGIDDSVPKQSIQTNEISYLTGLLGENGALFCAADELGMMGVARLYADLLPRRMQVNLRYFGGGQDDYADAFDTATLSQTVGYHLKELHMEEAAGNDGDADVLILTRNADEAEKDRFFSAWETNTRQGRLSLVIDLSGQKFSPQDTVQAISTTYTLGYTRWGTVANALGVGLSMGLVRWGWLRYETEARTADCEAFVKTLTFAFTKDLAYGRGVNGSLQDLTPQGIEKAMMEYPMTRQILDSLIGSTLLRSLTLTDFCAPLGRSFEIRFHVVLES